MGRIIAKKVRGMNRMAKISLILVFTMVFSIFIHKPAQAAITAPQAWTNIYHAAAYPGTIAYTVNAGTKRVLVVAIASARTTAGTETMTSVTYGGVAMTQAVGDAASSAVQHTYLYYLKDNAVMNGAAQNIVITMTGGTSRYNDVFAGVFAGVDQTTTITDFKNYNSLASATLSTTTFATALTVNANDQAVKIAFGVRTASATARTISNFGTSWTSVATQTWAATASGRNAAGNRAIPTTNTTDVSTVTFSGTIVGSMSGISLKADVSDATPPVVNTFTATSPSASLNIPISAFTASDAVGVTGYMIKTSATPPLAGDAGWTGTAPTTYTVGSDGTYTLYPWAKDAAGNVSIVFATPRTVVVDSTKPTVSTFTATTPSASLNIPITAFTASDAVGVTGYKITTSATPPLAGDAGWTGTAPVTYTVASDGTYTLYPWAKDAVGNVSNVFGSPRTVLVDTAPPINLAASSPADGASDQATNTTVNASPATDPNGPVQYYFEVTSDSAFLTNIQTGGWQTGTSYAPTLVNGLTYYWHVKARDGAGNETVFTIDRNFSVIGPCYRNNPTLTLAPTQHTINANGGTYNYTLTIRNNDYGGCVNTTFNLSVSDTDTEGNFDAPNLSSSTATLAPGAQTTRTVTVTATAGKLSGMSLTRVTSAADANHGPVTTSVDATTYLNVIECNKITPTLVIGPDTANVAVGGSINYTVTVQNKDTGAGCSAVTYNIAILSESNVPSAHFNASTLSLPSKVLTQGEKGSVTLTVSAKAAAALGQINVTTIRVTTTDGHTSPPDKTATTTVGNSILHNSTNTSSTKWSSAGGWGIVGGKYGEFDCTTCHTSSDTTNIKRIKTSITTPDVSKGTLPGDGQTVVYDRQVGTKDQGVFGFDSGGATPRTTSSKICETCHTYDVTQTNGVKAHPYNSAGNTLPNHQNADGTDCIMCHKHNQGFKPPTCTSCHGNPPGPLASSPFSTGSATAGKHTTHVTTLNYTCNYCHGTSYQMPEASTVPSLAGKGDIDISFETFGSTTGTYTGQTGVSYNNVEGTGTKQCSNVYCHSNIQNQTNGGATGLTYATPVWDGTIACGSCHKSDGVQGDASLMDSGSHTKHVVSSSYACSKCHNGKGSGTATHVNNDIDIAFDSTNPSGVYSQIPNTPGVGYGTCSTTYCHGSGTPAWGGSTSCTSCHDASGLTTTLSTRHDKHYNTAAAASVLAGGADAHTSSGYVYACLNCHPTNQHATGPVSGVQDAAIGGTKQLSGNYTPAVTNLTDGKAFKYTNYGTCSTVCHTKDGVTLGTSVTGNPTWNSANAVACGFCHNKAGDGGPTWSTPHTKHINTYLANTNITCEVCHTGTAASNSALQASGRNQHPNANRDLAFGSFAGATAAASGAQGSQQCSNVYCHGNGTTTTPTVGPISWSGTFSTCAECHGNAASLATGSHTKHLAVSGVTCNYCHNATASSSTVISSTINHVNKNVTINFNASASGASGAYNGSTAGGATVYQKGIATAVGTCSTTTCHGAGTPTWGADTTNVTCTKCHGTGTTIPVDATNRYLVAPPKNVAGGTSTATGTGQVDTAANSKIGAHQTHLQLLNGLKSSAVETLDNRCEDCHGTLPVSGSHADGTASPQGKFQGLATKSGAMSPTYASYTCTNTYCHNPAGSGGTLAVGNVGTDPAPVWNNAAYISDGGYPTNKTQTNCDRCHLTPNGSRTISATQDHSGYTISSDCSVCHEHNGETSGTAGRRHMDGVKYGAGGSCNSCHGYGPSATDGKAERSAVAEGKGAHEKHVNHLVALWGGTLNPSGDAFGSGASWTNVCGVCHNGASHNMSETIPGTGRTISILTSYQFGASAPVYNGTVGVSSGTTPKTCSNISCHFSTTPVWSAY